MDGLTSRLPGAGMLDEPASFPRGLLTMGNSDSLWYLTAATPISLHSSHASFTDIAQKGRFPPQSFALGFTPTWNLSAIYTKLNHHFQLVSA